MFWTLRKLGSQDDHELAMCDFISQAISYGLNTDLKLNKSVIIVLEVKYTNNIMLEYNSYIRHMIINVHE